MSKNQAREQYIIYIKKHKILGKRKQFDMLIDDNGDCWIYNIDLTDTDKTEVTIKIPSFVQGFISYDSIDITPNGLGEYDIKIKDNKFTGINNKTDKEQLEIFRSDILQGEQGLNSGIDRLIIDGGNIPLIGSMQGLFAYQRIKNIEFKDFNASGIDSLEGCFKHSIIEQISFNGAKFDSLKSIKGMCENCYKLKYADLSLLNLTKIEDMSKAFLNNESLEVVILPEIELRHKTNLSKTFYNCRRLKEINLENIKTVEAGQSLYDTFKNCTSLEMLYFKNINFKLVENRKTAIEGCVNVHTIDLSSMTEQEVRESIANWDNGMRIQTDKLQRIIVKKGDGTSETIEITRTTEITWV